MHPINLVYCGGFSFKAEGTGCISPVPHVVRVSLLRGFPWTYIFAACQYPLYYFVAGITLQILVIINPRVRCL